MTTRRRPSRTTPPAAKQTVEETPHLIRSFAADIALANAKTAAPVVELSEGQFYRFASRIPPALNPWFIEQVGKTRFTLQESVDFLTDLVVPADRDRLLGALSDTEVVVDPPIVHDIRNQLVSFYLGRPTLPLPSSPSGPSADGAASEPGVTPTTTATRSTLTRAKRSTSSTAGR